MNDKVELVIASFAIPLFVLTILFSAILLISVFSGEKTVEEKRDVLIEVELENEVENLEVEIEDLNLHFIEGVNRVYYSNELSLQKEDDYLLIAKGDGFFDNLHMVDSDLIIQNNHFYNQVRLVGDELSVDGRLRSESLEIDYQEIDLDTIIIANEIDINSKQIRGNSFFESEELRIESQNLTADFELEGQQQIEIIADELDARLKFVEQESLEDKKIILNGSGEVEILLSEAEQENLEIESSPEIEVKINYY